MKVKITHYYNENESFFTVEEVSKCSNGINEVENYTLQWDCIIFNRLVDVDGMSKFINDNKYKSLYDAIENVLKVLN